MSGYLSLAKSFRDPVSPQPHIEFMRQLVASLQNCSGNVEVIWPAHRTFGKDVWHWSALPVQLEANGWRLSAAHLPNSVELVSGEGRRLTLSDAHSVGVPDPRALRIDLSEIERSELPDLFRAGIAWLPARMERESGCRPSPPRG